MNHIPGASYFTSKVDLAKYTTNLTFVPKSFLLPKQHSEFTEYQRLHPEITWVRKGRSHRGVRIVHPKDASLAQEDAKESVLQQFIRPYLIDECVALFSHSLCAIGSLQSFVGRGSLHCHHLSPPLETLLLRQRADPCLSRGICGRFGEGTPRCICGG